SIISPGLPGELYMRMLKAVILPLIVSSVIVGAASVDPKSNGKISGIAITYIIITNLAGSLFGLIVALIIKPGKLTVCSGQIVQMDTGIPETRLQTEDIFADLIRNLFPENIVASTFQKTQTKYNSREFPLMKNISGVMTNSTTTSYSLIILCALLGMAAGKRKEASAPFIMFFDATEKIISQVLNWIIWYTPIGVASLIAHALAKATDMTTNFTSLGYFVLTIAVGVLVYQFILFPIMIFIIFRTNPYKFHLSAVKAQMTAFVALSSAVAIPDMFRCVEEKHGVDPKVSRFVVPLAVTLNRDGSALFICATAIYIGQITDNLTAGTIAMMCILAFVGSLAVPAIPSASIITLLIILSSLNIPPANIGLIMALEWFTDRIRSTCNSYGCIICTVVTYKYTKHFLQEQTSTLLAPDQHKLKSPEPTMQAGDKTI
ncbi:hypothetical protein LOTGIDRAFT_128333, partial [Lottia gigantea]